MNKRPRRARRTGAGLLHAPETLPVQRHALQLNGKMIPPSALPLVPPASEPGRKAEAKLKPLRGLEYGPKFTCPVDTLLTVLAFVLSKKERKAMRKGEGQELAAGGAGPPADAAVEFAAATSRQAWRELALATRGLRKTGDSRAAKRKWYECMVTQQAAQKRRKAAGDPGSKHGRRASHTARNGAAASSGSCGAIECRCACRCLLCSTGRCQFCASCGCDTQRLLGHCFGLAEQLFHHLAPDGITSSLLHFCSHTAWACTRCAYGFATANGCQPHLPLLLSVEDVDALLASGVAPEVGALVSAHLGAAPYDYGACPSCGEGLLRSRPLAPRFPPLLLVEIGRPGVIGGGAHTDRFPWRLDLAPEMGLGLDGKAAAYRAVAVRAAASVYSMCFPQTRTASLLGGLTLSVSVANAPFFSASAPCLELTACPLAGGVQRRGSLVGRPSERRALQEAARAGQLPVRRPRGRRCAALRGTRSGNRAHVGAAPHVAGLVPQSDSDGALITAEVVQCVVLGRALHRHRRTCVVESESGVAYACNLRRGAGQIEKG